MRAMTVRPSDLLPHPPPGTRPSPAAEQMSRALSQLGGVILGKERQLRLALACLLAGGHLLIEDLPGVGKTTLAQALAATLGLEFGRVQFTSDLLPADVLGVSIYQSGSETFRFHPGPVFHQLLLADELNRATPRTQSALLEAMEERQVSIDGQTHPLPAPFFVVATQNPQSAAGTYPLPEAQLDRFLLSLTLGYPDPRAERELLQSGGRRAQAQALPAACDPAGLEAARREVGEVHVSGPLLDYVQLLLAATRGSAHFQAGLSPRAALGLLSAARAWAWLEGRRSVWPDDVRAVFPALTAHRLLGRGSGSPSPEGVQALLEEVPVP